jgi:crotonobetaine/carnitine-CoA ligase
MGALLMMLMKQPERSDDATNPVRRAYGAPAPIEIYSDFEKRFALQLVEVYGSTELGTATMNTVESFRVGSCGYAVPYFDVEIHDEQDNLCEPGTEGEIVVRPKEPSVMFDGYYKMPEATVAAFQNLWFHTGDRGKMDSDGYFYFIDRMKDAIRRRGENISSWEVEKVLNTHPHVLESAVVGVPSALTEEEVMAILILKPGQAADPKNILEFCEGKMAHFAIPRYFQFVTELPRTPSQRVEKYKLRQDASKNISWDRESIGYEVKR